MEADQSAAKNRFRFKTFSEQIAEIQIDVFHKVCKDESLPATARRSYFLTTLTKWKDLNCSQEFCRFSFDVNGLVHDLSQIVFHQNKIADILCKHLEVTNSQCLDALLDLVAQFARDLQRDFYPYFAKIFEIIVKLLDTQDAEIIEHSFRCIAHVFKYSWRYMLDEFKEIFRYLRHF